MFKHSYTYIIQIFSRHGDRTSNHYGASELRNQSHYQISYVAAVYVLAYYLLIMLSFIIIFTDTNNSARRQSLVSKLNDISWTQLIVSRLEYVNNRLLKNIMKYEKYDSVTF